MSERDHLQRLHAVLATGEDQLGRGEGREHAPEPRAEIIEAARKRARESQHPHSEVLP